MASDERCALAFKALRRRGFKPVATRRGARAFRGPLKTTRGTVPIEFEISDWDFQSYPRVALLERPDFLPKSMAHLDASGGLCYLRRGSVQLDRHDPGGAVLQCLNAATSLLDDLIRNPNQGPEDIRDEFLAYWVGGEERPIHVVLGEIAASATSAQYFIVDIPRRESSIVMIATDPVECERLARSLGAPSPHASDCRCWILRSAVYPTVMETSLPTTVKELFGFLKQWDPAIYNRVQQILENDKEYLKFSFVTFAIDTPAGWLGFKFDLHPLHREACKRNPRLYKQHLHGKGSARAISRMWITQVGATFVHGRNLAHVNLASKKIALIGCGAIGGYLAQGLVRLGGGSGRGGKLQLLDIDELGPENLGRHWLGIPALFLPKARAVAEELERQFPHARVDWKQANAAESLSMIFSADLVIDATGEEAVNELLNEAHLERRKSGPAMVYVWIKGNGECAQALWVDGKGGCRRCLRLPADAPQPRAERFPVLKREPETRFVGCHSFAPYAVSAPMQAAALALELIGDWLKGNPSPRFRTRAVASADLRSVRDQDISPLDKCPACSTR